MINNIEAYLFGLLCGRGHIYLNDKKIIIEFAHKNPTISGIAYCPKCDNLATEKNLGKGNKILVCKKCKTEVNKDVKKIYEQRNSTHTSITENIIPFLSHFYKNCQFDQIGNDNITYLIIDFINEVEKFEEINTHFNEKYGFDSFEIPKIIYESEHEIIVEFINGLMDTAGFFNAGSWFPSNGKNGIGRMRGYFQIVRNWKLPVQICNLLRSKLSLPIQTLDWGHPNIRDSKMEDYYNVNQTSWSREHQLKFYPEYYQEFSLRLNHKDEMFKELIAHNIKVEFDKIGDCSAPTNNSLNKVKPIHHGENDLRLPLEIRKHHDCFWQVCHNLGCEFTKNKINNSNNPDIYYLTGEDTSLNLDEEKTIYLTKSNELTYEIDKKSQKIFKEKIVKKEESIRTNPEQQLYAPLSEKFAIYLNHLFECKVLVHDTSAYYLDKFITQNNLTEVFDFCNDFKIKPDIVGFLIDKKQLAFMEVKIGDLTLTDLGQLLGYCFVAKPAEAILISPKEPNTTLKILLKTNPEILKYDEGKYIKIAQWINNEIKIYNEL
ncbi:hypothetical protein OBJ98_11520 [Empedobacter falsenii]